MINNAWKLNEADKSYQKGWTNKEENPNQKTTQQQFRPQSKQTQKASGFPGTSNNQGSFDTSNKQYGTTAVQYKAGSTRGSQMGGDSAADKAVEKMRTKLASRGARGFLGL